MLASGLSLSSHRPVYLPTGDGDALPPEVVATSRHRREKRKKGIEDQLRTLGDLLETLIVGSHDCG